MYTGPVFLSLRTDGGGPPITVNEQAWCIISEVIRRLVIDDGARVYLECFGASLKIQVRGKVRTQEGGIQLSFFALNDHDPAYLTESLYGTLKRCLEPNPADNRHDRSRNAGPKE